MKQTLSIDFSRTARPTRRAVWVFLYGIAAPLCTFFIIVLIFNVNNTAKIAPKTSNASIRIQINKHSLHQLNTLFARSSIVGSHYGVKDALFQAKKEITLHFNHQQLVGIGIDRHILQENVENYGLFTTHFNGNTLISDIRESEKRSTKLLLRGNGQLILENGIIPLHLKKKYLQLRGVGVPASKISTTTLPDEAEIDTFLHFPIDIMHVLGISDIQSLIHGFDPAGEILSISSADRSTTEDLAHIGRKWMQSLSLSTSVLTIDDGTQIQEILSPTQDIQSSIEQNETSSLITLRNGDDMLRIISTPELTRFTNREGFVQSGQNKQRNVCKNSAHSFISNTSPYFEPLLNQFGSQSFISIDQLSGIDIGRKSVYMCLSVDNL